MSIIRLENEYLKVGINSHGASLVSLYSVKYNKELLWQGDKESWLGQDICIFPFVARLKDGFYTVDERKYKMDIHGFIKDSELEVLNLGENTLSLIKKYDMNTLKEYPFKFDFIVSFTLVDNSLKVTYTVFNRDTTKIYYGIGGHPGFNLTYIKGNDNIDISANSLNFDKCYDLEKITLDESNCFVIGSEKYAKLEKITLDKKLFSKDAIILKNNFVNVTLTRGDDIKISMHSNSDYIAFWTHKKNGEYLCIEPWWSLPDMSTPNREISNKFSIKSTDIGMKNSYSYMISIE